MKKLLLGALLVSVLLNAKDFTNSIGIKFKLIPSASFMMGIKPSRCPKNDSFTSKNESKDCLGGTSRDELPYHQVRVNSFYMATTEVTQLQYYKVMGESPAYFKTEKLGFDSRNNPIETISWYDAKKFIKKLNIMEDTNKYRLPTESQWEYAAKAGSTTKWSFGDEEKHLADYAWYNGNKTHPVGKKKPNNFGLYDMHGNVHEWCEDWYTPSYNNTPTNGKANNSGERKYKVLRGGSWSYYTRNTRSADRSISRPDDRYNYIGFRLARTK